MRKGVRATDRKNVLTKALIVFLALMFIAGVAFGAVQVLSAEGQMPPEPPYVPGLTSLPLGGQDVCLYLDGLLNLAKAEKCALDTHTDVSIDDKSISFGEGGEIFVKSFIYAKDAITGAVTEQYPGSQGSFGEDFSPRLWNLSFGGPEIKSVESKEEGDRYLFHITCPDQEDPFAATGTVADSFHIKDSEPVLRYLRQSFEGFAVFDNISVRCTGLAIDASANRLENKIGSVTYTKNFEIKADAAFQGKLGDLGTKAMSFTLTEKTVFDYRWVGVTLTPQTLELQKGDIKVVGAAVSAPQGAKVTWSSSHPDIASVDAEGYVKALRVSTLPVTVTAAFQAFGKTYTGTCEVTVRVPVKKVTISDKKLTLAAGETRQLEAGVKPKDATFRGLLWYTNNPAVATVDENGNVTGVAKGATEIYVLSKDGYYKISCAVTVTG